MALYRSGVLVQIPRPERFAIHKLIVADRRQGGPDQAKARKDRAQAAFLIGVQAQDRPEDLLEAYEGAGGVKNAGRAGMRACRPSPGRRRTGAERGGRPHRGRCGN